MKKVGVLLAGCGVYDGSEIQEAILSLLAIDEAGAKAVCFAPDRDQYHVIDHLSGEESEGTRNILIESARIARGDIKPLDSITHNDFDALLIPGGFGAAKNLNKWAINGPEGEIDPAVRDLIIATNNADKPIGAVCMGPTVIAKAMEGADKSFKLTVGTTLEKSPYDIQGIMTGMESIGSTPVNRSATDICIDEDNQIVTGPCHMMEATIKDVRANTKAVVDELLGMVESE